jgi:hypothetical protein
VDKLALGRIFLMVLGFALSVSFRQCTILTHLPAMLYNLSIDTRLDNTRKGLPEFYGNPGYITVSICSYPGP